MIETPLLFKNGVYSFALDVAPADAERECGRLSRLLNDRFGAVDACDWRDDGEDGLISASFRAPNAEEAQAAIRDFMINAD